MTIHLTPNISEETIADLDVLDAFGLGEELLDSRYPRDAARVLRKVVDPEPDNAGPDNAAGWEMYGRAHFAAALGSSSGDSTRVELVDQPIG